MNKKPKGDLTQLEKRLAALSPEQRALFLRKVKQKAGDLNQTDRITVQRDRERFPLSFAQKQLWFLSQLEPDSTGYNVPLSLRLRGAIHLPALEQALMLLFEHQDILHTTFDYDEEEEDEEPFQIIAPLHTLLIPLVDVQHLPAQKREEIAEGCIKDQLQQPFNLIKGPLVRLLLLRIQPDDHALLLCMPHILCDGRSLHIITRELITAYTALTTGASITLSTLAIQYRDYAAWQRNYLQGQILDDLLHYWISHLGNIDMLKLPYDYPREVDSPALAGKVYFKLSPQTLTAAKVLCREENTTLFMLLLACFQLLLWHQTQQEEIIVGASMNNRRLPGTNDLVGLFVNMLPLKTRFHAQLPFREVLQRVRITCIDGYAHQDLPFMTLVQALPLKRLGSYVPLIQAACDFQKSVPPTATASEELMPLQIESFSDITAEEARFDLNLRISERKDAIHGGLEYNCSLFKETTITHIAQQFTQLVDTIVQSPDIVLRNIFGTGV